MNPMNMNIRRRFLKELLEDKTVAFEAELYRMYFRKIFPDSQEFVEFLTTSSEQKRLDSAMRILDRINFCSNFPIVEDVYANLVRLESEKLAGRNDSHVGQDHFVHTVNLYILGIYLFFNNPVFHSSLRSYFFDKRQRESSLETRNQLAVKSFLSAWKYYVCSHDIGYPFEALADLSGQIKDPDFRSAMMQYSNLRKYQAYSMTLKIMAKLLYCLYLFQNAVYPLEKIAQGDQEEFDGQWLDKADPNHVRYPLSTIIQKSGCGHYVRLEFIQSYEGIKALMPLIKWQDVAILSRDSDGEPVVLNYFAGEIEQTWLHSERQTFSEAQLRHIRLFGSDEFPAEGYSCTYFVQAPEDCLQEHLEKIGVGPYCAEWRKLADGYFACRHELFVELSNVEEGSDGVIYKIYRDILRRFPHSTLNEGFLDLWREEHKDGMTPKLRNQIIEVITEAVQKVELQAVSKAEWQDCIKKAVSDALENNWGLLCGEGTVEDRISNEVQGLKTMLNLLYNKVREFFERSTELVSFQKKGRHKKSPLIQCDLLGTGVSEGAGIEAELYRRFLEQLEGKLREAELLKAEQHMPDFIRYHRDFSCFDHGIMSATLLLSTVVNFCCVAKRMAGKNDLLLLVWDIEPEFLVRKLEEKGQQILVEAIYTVMLHNLYPNVYQAILGNELSHSLLKNPFVYFGLFCDSLQLWDRVQQIKPAERSLDFSLEGNRFDLRIWKNQIYLLCPLSCHEKVRKKCQEMDSYLLGAEGILQVSGTAGLPQHMIE